MERTFVMVKPDGVGRGLVGEVVGRLERKGLRLVGLKLIQISDDAARAHYRAHVAKPFFAGLIRFITSGPVVAMVVEGEGAVDVVRTLMGATDPAKAAPGTLRGDLAMIIDANVVHGSDSAEAAREEIALYFKEDELVTAARPEETWIYRRS